MEFATLDYIILAVIATCGLLGMMSGFLAQLCGLSAMVAAWCFAKPLGEHVAPRLSVALGVESSQAAMLGSILGALAIFIGVKIIFALISRAVNGGAKPTLRIGNRMLGGVFAATKSFVLIWLILCVISAHTQQFNKLTPEVSRMLHDSRMQQVIEHWNPIAGETVVARR